MTSSAPKSTTTTRYSTVRQDLPTEGGQAPAGRLRAGEQWLSVRLTRDVVRTWLSIRGYLVSAGHGTYCWLPSSSPVESVLPSTGWDLRSHLSTRPPTAAAGQSRNRPDETECETP